MVESKFPICPIWKREVLLPFSIMQVGAPTIAAKVYGTWICSNCGFFLSTKDNRAVNPDKDIEAGFSIQLSKKIEKLRKQYNKEHV